MTQLTNNPAGSNSLLAGKSIEELLKFVADDEQGFSAEAAELLLAAGIDAVYPVLEQGLRDDDDADFRNGSMDILVAFGRKSIPYLLKLLQDPNEEVRNFTCVMLGDIGNSEAVHPLINALSDQDPNVSHSAAEALGKIGDRAALFPLIELLKGDFWVQFSAIAAIGEMRDYRAVPHLLNLLDDELLAGAAADALGKIGDPRALPPLGVVLPKMDDEVAGHTARAIMAIYKSATDAQNFKNSLTEYHQPEHLRKVLGSAGVDKLLALLGNSNDNEVLEAVVMLLGWYGKVEAIEGFFPLLKNEALHDAIEAAILSLGRKADLHLLAALEEGDDSVKTFALRALRYLGNEQCSTKIAGFLISTDKYLQLEAIEAAKIFPGEDFIPLLLEIVKMEPAEVAAKAAEALACYRFTKVRDFIAGLAGADSSSGKMRGALLLSQFCEDREPRLLDILLLDSDAGVRKAALKATPKQGLDAAVPRLGAALLDSDPAVRATAIQTLAEFHKPLLVDDILALLGTGDEAVDYAVIKTLGIMGAREAENSLLEYLKNNNPAPRVEYALLETFGKIAAASASQLICSRYLPSENADIRRLAVETLGRLGDSSSLKAVESALEDRHWSVRVAALQVMGRLGGTWEIPYLLGAINDPDNLVRKHAILSLGKIRSHLAIPALVQQLDDMDMSRHAFCALLNFGQQILPWLHRHMHKNYSVDIRVRLIDLIGKFGSRKSVEPLMELLEDPSPVIRLAAIDSLAFCFDAMLLKKLTAVKKYDVNDEVKERANLALTTFTMEKYS